MIGRAGYAAAAVLLSTAACGVRACEVRVLEARSGKVLQAIALGSLRRFDLTYLHSVTHTPVRETLALEQEGLVQQRIEFTEQGPGMPTQVLEGERFTREGGRFVFDQMHRPVQALRMRVDPAQRQALEAGGQTYSLVRWGRHSLQLLPHGCDGS
jgi:hypothetical protein